MQCIRRADITKKIMDLTRKKQVVKWQTSPVGVLNCDTAVSIRFLERLGLVSVLKIERLVSSRSWRFGKMERLGLVSVLKVDRFGLVSVLWLNVLWTSLCLSLLEWRQQVRPDDVTLQPPQQCFQPPTKRTTSIVIQCVSLPFVLSWFAVTRYRFYNCQLVQERRGHQYYADEMFFIDCQLVLCHR